MKVGQRYTKEVTFVELCGGGSPKTAQYGAEYVFSTDSGERLYWDTMSQNIISQYNLRDKVTISFKVIEDTPYLRKNSFKISNVRIVSRKDDV